MHSDKFLDRVDNLDDNSKKLTYNYFTKFEAITNLLEIVLKKKKLIRGSFGNFNAKTVFIVNYDNTNDKIIEIIKKYYDANNADFYSLYVTSIDKFNDKELDLKILDKELKIINPNKIIVIGSDISFENSVSFNKLDELLRFLNLDEKERKNNNEFCIIRDEFDKCIKFALYD